MPVLPQHVVYGQLSSYTSARFLEEKTMFEGIPQGVVWATTFTLLGALLGIAALLVIAPQVPRIIGRFTPHIDEEMEIARGNRAVADYHGRIAAATITGLSMIIAAAIIAGIHG